MAKRDSYRGYARSGGDEDKLLYWTVETDWFAILIGRGVFGLFVYLALFFCIFKKNIARTNKAIAMAVFAGGVGYYYDSAIFSCFMVYFCGSTKNIEEYI